VVRRGLGPAWAPPGLRGLTGGGTGSPPGVSSASAPARGVLAEWGDASASGSGVSELNAEPSLTW
jgi:hypothetical protein